MNVWSKNTPRARRPSWREKPSRQTRPELSLQPKSSTLNRQVASNRLPSLPSHRNERRSSFGLAHSEELLELCHRVVRFRIQRSHPDPGGLYHSLDLTASRLALRIRPRTFLQLHNLFNQPGSGMH